MQFITLNDAQERPAGFVWDFRTDKQTFLQTDSDMAGHVRWYLTHASGEPGDDPAYSMEIHPSADAVLEALAHLSSKSWVDKAQLLEAILPAIRALVWPAEVF